MPKPKLSELDYIAELNRQLMAHEYYREGMEFVPNPENGRPGNLLGYSVRGGFDRIGVFAQVCHRVAEQFDVEFTPTA